MRELRVVFEKMGKRVQIRVFKMQMRGNYGSIWRETGVQMQGTREGEVTCGKDDPELFLRVQGGRVGKPMNTMIAVGILVLNCLAILY